jgi:hypothetical protein
MIDEEIKQARQQGYNDGYDVAKIENIERIAAMDASVGECYNQLNDLHKLHQDSVESWYRFYNRCKHKCTKAKQ